MSVDLPTARYGEIWGDMGRYGEGDERRLAYRTQTSGHVADIMLLHVLMLSWTCRGERGGRLTRAALPNHGDTLPLPHAQAEPVEDRLGRSRRVGEPEVLEGELPAAVRQRAGPGQRRRAADEGENALRRAGGAAQLGVCGGDVAGVEAEEEGVHEEGGELAVRESAVQHLLPADREN